MARARLTITFTACPRETSAAGFCRYLYWIAPLNPDDPDHDRVTAFDLAPERPPLVTTEEVLTEFLTYFSGRGTLFRRKAATVATLYEMTRTSVF